MKDWQSQPEKNQGTKSAAIYARVSSERQKEEGTIGSQIASLVNYAGEQGYLVPQEWILQDEGYSGSTLARPGLERVRDLACEGVIQTVLVYSPDRLSRKYAYQVLLLEEFSRQGVEVDFIKSPKATTPEEQSSACSRERPTGIDISGKPRVLKPIIRSSSPRRRWCGRSSSFIPTRD